MISYELAATVPVEQHVSQLAATPDDSACAVLTGEQYLAVVSGTAATVVQHGSIYTSSIAGIGVARTGEFYVSLPPMSCVAILSGDNDGSRRDLRCTFNPGLICVPPSGTQIYVVTEAEFPSPTGSVNQIYGVAVMDTVGGSTSELASFGEDTIYQLVTDPNGGQLFVRGFNTIHAVDLATQAVRSISETATTGMAVSPDGSCLYLLAAGPPQRIDVVSTSTPEVLSSFAVTDLSSVSGIAVSSDGVHLLLAGSVLPSAGSATQNLVLLVKEVATGQSLTSVSLDAAASSGPVVSSPDGSLIFVPTDEPTTIAIVQRKVELLFLDVKVTVGSAPAWLVSRYAVECTYTTLTGDHTCASADFDAGGGTSTGQVSDDGGHFPAVVNIAVTIDFTPASGLAGIVRYFTPAVTDVGVNFLFEPDQMMQTVELIFDLTSPPPQPNDFLSVQWQHHVDDGIAGTGTMFLSAQDLAGGPVIRTDITLMPAGAPGTLAVTIQGRYQGAVLITYSGLFDVLNTAVVLRPQLAAGGSYTLAVAT